ncbi:hypothetical protein ASA1KI_43610 [Opitutales bacterium ASA1]|uniref:hypothetical protein n=1 Tax=Congregicoccus parvus TaxID=3081749 RepID=UPI002B312487|nr:hypothetical protein ASA1KI_43610 [Opitutales bacterium ASA1]
MAPFSRSAFSVLVFAWTCASTSASVPEPLQKAVAALASAPGYTWTSTVTGGDGSPLRFGGANVKGKVDAEGTAVIVTETRQTSLTTVVRGETVVLGTQDGWFILEEFRARVRGGQPGPAGVGSRARGGEAGSPTLPAEDLARMIAAADSLEGGGDSWTGTIPADKTAGLVPGLGRGRGMAGEARIEATLAVHLVDAAVKRYTIRTTGTLPGRDGDPQPIDLLTTVEIDAIGATTVEIPPAAAARLDG